MKETGKPLAFLCHPYHRGGVTRWMVDAASEWVRRGGESWFVVPRPRQAFLGGAGRPALASLVEALEYHRRPSLIAPVVGPEFEFGTAGYRARVYARALKSAVPPGVPVIVSDDPSTWLAVEWLGGRNPLIGVLHADDAPYYTLAARFHSCAAALVAVSRRVSSRARAVVDMSAVIEVIPCGIVMPPVVASEVGGPEITRLVWVGRISETQKRVSDLVAIGLALEAAGHPFSLDVIGDGESAGTLRADVARAGLADRVAFHGWVSADRVLAKLRSSDIMLLPSNFEGMPVAAMEALACGCAVVGSDTCGLEEYAHLDHSRSVLWIYPCGDIPTAAEATAAAARIAKDERRIAARRLAEAEFAIDVCMDRYESVLDRLRPAALRSVGVAPWHPADVMSAALATLRRGSAWLRRTVFSRPPSSSASVAQSVA